MFKKDIITENNISFPENITVWEDIYFLFKYLLCCNKISIINQSLYYYRIRENSAVNSNESTRKIKDKLKILDLLEELDIQDKDYFDLITTKKIKLELNLIYKQITDKEITKNKLKSELIKLKKLKEKSHIKFNMKEIFKYIYINMKAII